MSFFYPFISVEIPRKDSRRIDADHDSLSEFWDYVDQQIEPGLSYAVGCYIFAVRAGQGSRPWYVGRAEKQSFRDECFTSHKIMHYNNTVYEMQGTPLLKLIAKRTPTGRFSRRSANGHKDVEFLENMLITWCVQRNPDLKNVKSAQRLRDMVVPGLLNNPRGRDGEGVDELRSLLDT